MLTAGRHTMASPVNPFARRFGRNLRRARKRSGLFQEEAGFRASLHRTEIGLLERGERVPRIDTAVKLAGAVDATVGELLAGIEWTPGMARRGEFAVESRKGRHEEAMRRAAALRARQTEVVDGAELVHEAREDLAGRTEQQRKGGS